MLLCQAHWSPHPHGDLVGALGSCLRPGQPSRSGALGSESQLGEDPACLSFWLFSFSSKDKFEGNVCVCYTKLGLDFKSFPSKEAYLRIPFPRRAQKHSQACKAMFTQGRDGRRSRLSCAAGWGVLLEPCPARWAHGEPRQLQCWARCPLSSPVLWSP